ncbi:putative acetyltransferase [compost metagenome]
MLNGAVVGKGSIVGAGCVVPENMVIPPNSLVVGVPAKVIKEITPDQRKGIEMTAEAYVGYARGYKRRFG